MGANASTPRVSIHPNEVGIFHTQVNETTGALSVRHRVAVTCETRQTCPEDITTKVTIFAPEADLATKVPCFKAVPQTNETEELFTAIAAAEMARKSLSKQMERVHEDHHVKRLELLAKLKAEMEAELSALEDQDDEHRKTSREAAGKLQKLLSLRPQMKDDRPAPPPDYEYD